MAPRDLPHAAEPAPSPGDRVRVRRTSRRLAGAIQDLRLGPDERLTEQERALLSAMLLGLVERAADEIRVRLPDALSEACECDASGLLLKLVRHGLLLKPAFVELLLRRADSVRLREAVAARQSSFGETLLQKWAREELPAVASGAMAIVIARAAARDRFGRPGVDLGDCPAEIAVDLVYAVAAVLIQHCGPQSEEAIVAAAGELLRVHDEGERLDALEARLVLALEQAGRLNEAILLALAGAGEVSLLAYGLARLARVSAESGWALFADPADGRLALLLRMAEQPRSLAASLLVQLAAPLGLRDPAVEIDMFDRISVEDASQARARLRLPPAYQLAATALEAHGQRPA